jgi:hypothetical protein
VRNSLISKRALAAVAAAALAFVSSASSLADTDGNASNSNSCFAGTAAANDYATFNEDFAAGAWSSSSGVHLLAQSQRVTLAVTDSYGNSVCQNTADLSTSCTFEPGLSTTFTIVIDNSASAVPADYQLCTF